MKKFSVLCVCACLMVGSQALYAEEKKESAPNFWEKLRAKIEQMAPQKKVATTTAVGGVRGAKMAVDDVYWKGEKAAQVVDEAELEAFTSAMKLVAAGEKVKARAAFAEFVSKNPDSPLRKDADLAQAQLIAEK